jgi:phosphomannomutase
MVRDFPDDLRLVVGYDRRFMSDVLAGEVSRDLASLGIQTYLIPRPVPPAALTFAIQRVDALGGIIITAGNEHPTFSGIKLRSWDGGALPRWMLNQIEEVSTSSASAMRVGPTAQAIQYDPMDDYLKSIETVAPLREIQESGITAVIDAHWGLGSELIPQLTDGAGSRSVEIRSAHNPLFPELHSLLPIVSNLDRVRRLVRTGDAALGLAISADATVLGLIDEHGIPVPSEMLGALIAWYLLLVRRQRGSVGRSISAPSAIDRIAEAANVPVHELPCGHTSACESVREHSPLLTVNEKGAISVSSHQFEPDALVAALLVMGCVVRSGKHLSEVVEEVRELCGDRQVERVRISLTPGQVDRVQAHLARQNWPDEIAGYRIDNVYVTDGTKFEFGEGSWLLLRYDELEAVLEIVAESETPGAASQLLGAGRQIIFS